MSLAAANREIIRLVRDGVKVTFKDSDRDDVADTVKVVDRPRPAHTQQTTTIQA